jgi:hypothetical protein
MGQGFWRSHWRGILESVTIQQLPSRGWISTVCRLSFRTIDEKFSVCMLHTFHTAPREPNILAGQGGFDDMSKQLPRGHGGGELCRNPTAVLLTIVAGTTIRSVGPGMIMIQTNQPHIASTAAIAIRGVSQTPIRRIARIGSRSLL